VIELRIGVIIRDIFENSLSELAEAGLTEYTNNAQI
jgi:hypothetical protein